ncbi:hydrolase [Mycobacterium gordonae]|uniref:nitrilase-related carbon-nitrogen hydrolase n=1 Tax=Mycobacterium gordonae TaxID=1778 RepID=UPI00210C463F|nr:nitrilase-related carbon-nitrogen hydrolase [Mycobacterium gordonae]MCQ4363590.1 hydrolase [Mycobacterium gordonae]
MITLTADAPDSPTRTQPPGRPPLRVAVVQHRWRYDRTELEAVLREGISRAADAGARVVFLPELTLSRYPGNVSPPSPPAAAAEDLHTGPTFTFAAQSATAHGLFVHASLFEKAAPRHGPDDGLGYNTAILVSPGGELVARVRKMHIPNSEGYCEGSYFRPGPADDDPYPVHEPHGLAARLGLPTCWDQWFPEVARTYSLKGAEIVAYPSAIGSEPVFPHFDTEPQWRQVIVGNGIANGLFMIVANRTGVEGKLRFYGSSFISDPYGRVLVQAPRGEEALLIADLDLDQRRDWLEAFPLLRMRRPDSYGAVSAAE